MNAHFDVNAQRNLGDAIELKTRLTILVKAL